MPATSNVTFGGSYLSTLLNAKANTTSPSFTGTVSAVNLSASGAVTLPSNTSVNGIKF